jgi:hypothetical protein
MEGWLAFLGAFAGVVVSSLVQMIIARIERIEARRRERLEFHRKALQDVMDARVEIQSTSDASRQSAAILKAYAVGMSVNDEIARKHAQAIFQDNSLIVQSTKIDPLIVCLGNLHSELLNQK